MNKIKVTAEKLQSSPNPYYKESAAALQKGLAAAFGDISVNPDLSYLFGIMTSSAMNKNDLCFLPSEMIKALPTIYHKPLDIEHKVEEEGSLVKIIEEKSLTPFRTTTNTIVGTIYDAAIVHPLSGSVLLASDMVKDGFTPSGIFDLATVDENFLDPSNVFHLITAIAMWKFLFPETIADIVSRVDAGQMALSMECYFPTYDFLLNGKVLSRSEHPELQKVLENKSMKIGTVPRGIIWGGVGAVKNPANPFAFDFITAEASEKEKEEQEEKKLCYAAASLIEKQKEVSSEHGSSKPNQGVLIKMEIDKMVEMMRADAATARTDAQKATERAVAAETLAKETASKNDTLSKEVAELKKALAEAETAGKTKDEEMKKNKEQCAVEAEAAKKKMAEQEAASKEAASKAEAANKELATAKASVEDLTKKVAAFETEVKYTARVASLTEDGLYVEEMDVKEAIASLSDEKFEALKKERATLKQAYASQPNGAVAPFLAANKTDIQKAVASVSQSGKSGNKYSEF